ncbi:probable E3 ubiquitin-protein ligase RNF144A-B [Limulus polyphemus]|uniref:RBR-type E3 ubiquitin transferase n=1 Tax=Limulus polyphemus TaxID=6850 RepID=A0ABM1BXA4_LIMPO|nr:probable E3 ubiquitin-protein ligase RNF144A-B [Limulus polyphemus]
MSPGVENGGNGSLWFSEEKNRPSKTTARFSLRNWLFRRDEKKKGFGLPKSKSVEEGYEGKKLVPKSKSCDSGVAAYLISPKNKETCKSSSVIMKKVPSMIKKSSTPCGRECLKVPSATKMLKTSFSSGDICKSWSSPKIGQCSGLKITKCTSQHNIKPKNFGLYSGRIHPLKETLSVSDLFLQAAASSQDLSAISLQKVSFGRDSNPVDSNVIHQLVLCKLCLMMVPQGALYQLKECGCSFCEMCLQQYLTVNIQDGNVVITCPDGECGKEAKILVSEVEKLVNADVFDQFKRFKLNREIELDPTRAWCPSVNCETICYVRPAIKGEEWVAVFCPKCGLTFCSVCKEKWHPSKTCDEVRKDVLEEEDFLLWDAENGNIKRCPNCHILIERDEGCAQMMCKRCKHVFCWYCLTSLDDDFLLRHYDKGPCKNKLGHTRASVVWHRTQVVCIFAGFGFLLLVASPLLLLGAPCFLCCQCKQCKLSDEEPTAV